jgi:hypothetical protein
MKLDGRNTLAGIADRVHKNLAFITFSRNMGADVHEVTQLLLSLLGLIVFPVEDRIKGDKEAFAHIALSDLAKDGWPSWKFIIGESTNLRDLLFHLRNAVSHRRLRFSSDSRDIADVDIEFRDRKPKATDDYWGARIKATDLRSFVLLLSDYLKDYY